MSKKLAYIISAAVFVVLCGLIVCEKLFMRWLDKEACRRVYEL